MNLRLKIGIILFCILTSLAAVVNYVMYNHQKKYAAMLESNIRYGYETGFRIIDSYKTKNGQLAARNYVLEMTTHEIRNGLAQDVIRQLDNLGIKPKQVTNYSQTVINHEKEIVARLRDSVIFDTAHVSCINYSDRFYEISGYIMDNNEHLKIKSSDSLTQVIYHGARFNKKGHKVPGICFWIPRRLEQVITSNNPSSQITYSKTISVKK